MQPTVISGSNRPGFCHLACPVSLFPVTFLAASQPVPAPFRFLHLDRTRRVPEPPDATTEADATPPATAPALPPSFVRSSFAAAPCTTRANEGGAGKVTMKVTNSAYCLEYHPGLHHHRQLHQPGLINFLCPRSQAGLHHSAQHPTNHESTWPSAFIFCGLSVDTSRLARAHLSHRPARRGPPEASDAGLHRNHRPLVKPSIFTTPADINHR